tara:strand:- start:3281 stop:3961 length:681 start_codon:yes stop_codon:yes gene_type:complete
MINLFKNLGLIIVISTCFYLGLWQLDRAEEKLVIQTDFINQVSKSHVDLRSVGDNPTRYTKIYTSGKFLEPYFLLDNIVFNRKAGYYVISPFILNNKVLLVNRGWVENYSRQKFPIINTPEESILIKGHVKYPMRLLELSKSNITSKEPYVLQNLDISEISKILNIDIYSFILTLDKNSQYSYQFITEKHENKHIKHYMYAGQWFLFTIIGIVFLVILNRKKDGKN